MKAAILNTLRRSRTVVSGARLSTALGISRVSVWKHIQKLQELGYDISATSKGYQLLGSPDTPFPWEFPARKGFIHYHDRVDSTMTIARSLARDGAPNLTTVIAGSQTRGRGRLARQWFSDEGGVYMTVVVRPEIPLLLGSRVNFVASLAMTHVLRDHYGVNALAKWPNDILVDDKKILGMLSEMEVSADMVAFINIGMGLNANNDPTRDEPGAVSLSGLVGKPVSRCALIGAFLDDFEHRMACVDYDTVVAEWKQLTMTLGRQVRIATTGQTLEGRAVDVEADGALILELPCGTRRRVIYGDCFFPTPHTQGGIS